jgi:uncharacterized protein YbjT (DUF2867 family)
MILVTGGTGFIGRALVRNLVDAGYPVRTLIRPSPHSPRLPVGVPVEAAVVSLNDVRGLRAAMRDVDMVFHLASAEHQGRNANLMVTDVQGSLNVAKAAADAGVKRIFYVSHLDASRSAGFPVLKAKGIAEEHIRRSGVPYTIFQTSVVFGPEDHFTSVLARLLRRSPGLFPIPGRGDTIIQPLWIEDLVTCMLWSIEQPETANQTFEIGGSEYFSLRQVLEILLDVTHTRRILVSLSVPTLRALTITLEAWFKDFPISSFWLDYFAVNRTCPVDNLPRAFGLMPARFNYRLEYLHRQTWLQRLWNSVRSTASKASKTINDVLETIRTSH